ncbi:hypothetical protein [Bradyrhizobium sp. sGM-13]|uniref:hypothetical protein n=1 Tax=Bradyrhizobium sp. sGM-13 TaxID=2831781 RepID=UPI001BCEE57B|nr:hypothetical protein [Bradyrhizobium sp. sGM-13]
MTFDYPVIAIILSSLFLSSSALAKCDISKFDNSPPIKIIDKVNNGTVYFEWSSDVDVDKDRSWVWHYIRNVGDRGLGYKWPKAALRRALGNPLEPGDIDCNRYLVTGATAVDDNAPITFGTNETVQRAAVFAETKSSSAQSSSSIIETSYRTSSGATVDVRIGVHTGRYDNDRWQLLIDQQAPNVAVAISLPNDIDQYAFLARQLQADGPIKFDAKTLAALYSETELEERLTRPYLVLPRRDRLIKHFAVLPAGRLRETSSDLMLLDGDARPFFATTVRLLTPDNAR